MQAPASTPDPRRRRLLAAALSAGVASQLPACQRQEDRPGAGDIAALDRTPIAGVVQPAATASVAGASCANITWPSDNTMAVRAKILNNRRMCLPLGGIDSLQPATMHLLETSSPS